MKKEGAVAKKRRYIQVICVALTLITVLSGCGRWVTNKDRTCRHVWDSGTVTVTATCSSEGEKKYTCKDCGEVKTETLAKNNVHSAEVIERIAPTCTEEGKGYGIFCAACKKVLYEPQSLPALGHNYGADGICQNGGTKCPVLDENELPPVPFPDDDENWTANY